MKVIIDIPSIAILPTLPSEAGYLYHIIMNCADDIFRKRNDHGVLTLSDLSEVEWRLES